MYTHIHTHLHTHTLTHTRDSMLFSLAHAHTRAHSRTCERADGVLSCAAAARLHAPASRLSRGARWRRRDASEGEGGRDLEGQGEFVV